MSRTPHIGAPSKNAAARRRGLYTTVLGGGIYAVARRVTECRDGDSLRKARGTERVFDRDDGGIVKCRVLRPRRRVVEQRRARFVYQGEWEMAADGDARAKNLCTLAHFFGSDVGPRRPTYGGAAARHAGGPPI